ncbi:hypothetical protein CsSME_00040165 [Camellia sinensis var. sinensis]
MCNAFYEVTELAEDSEDRYEKVMERMYELNISFKEGSCRSNEDISKVHQKNPTSCANGFGIPKESINILDPSKRRPPYKRKQSKVEKVIKKRKESKKKTHTTSNKENMHKQIDESVEKVVEPMNHRNMHDTSCAMGFVGLGTQESINLNSQHIGGRSYDFQKASHMRMSPFFGQPNLPQGGSAHYGWKRVWHVSLLRSSFIFNVERRL